MACVHDVFIPPLFSSFHIFASWRDTVMELYFPACPENHELDLFDNGHTLA